MACDKPFSSKDKWVSAIIAGLLFLLLASPVAYNLSNSVLAPVGLSTVDRRDCPNVNGLVVHAILFTLILRLIMAGNFGGKNCKKYSSKDKWVCSLIGGLLFLLIASPFLYEAVNTLTAPLGLDVADRAGCPNINGLVLHSIVFVLLVRLLMR
jgi:hypothetical protein